MPLYMPVTPLPPPYLCAIVTFTCSFSAVYYCLLFSYIRHLFILQLCIVLY